MLLTAICVLFILITVYGAYQKQAARLDAVVKLLNIDEELIV